MTDQTEREIPELAKAEIHLLQCEDELISFFTAHIQERDPTADIGGGVVPCIAVMLRHRQAIRDIMAGHGLEF